MFIFWELAVVETRIATGGHVREDLGTRGQPTLRAFSHWAERWIIRNECGAVPAVRTLEIKCFAGYVT